MKKFYDDANVKERTDYIKDQWASSGTFLPALPQDTPLLSEYLMTENSPLMRAATEYFKDPEIRDVYPYFPTTSSQ